MRKKDIVITTPKHSTIYGIGNNPESSDYPFEDFGSYGYNPKHYTPGYVLEIQESGFIVALVARYHPEATLAKLHKQASLLDAAGYSLADFEARQEVMQRYSHWDGDMAEGRKERDEVLSKLKEVPTLWNIRIIRTTYVRMLWADYTLRLEAAIGERNIARDQKKAKAIAVKEAKRGVLEKLVEFGLLPEANVENILNRSYDSRLDIPYDLISPLIHAAEFSLNSGGYEFPKPPTKEV